MNNERRKTLQQIIRELNEVFERLEEIKGDLENVRDEEQEAFDNMPESLQNGDRGQAAEAAISALDNALDYFPEPDDLVNSIEEAME